MKSRALALLACIAAGLCVGCAAPSPRAPTPAAASLDVARAEVVDLTHPYDERAVYWPTSPSRFELKSLHSGPTEAGYWYEANTFCTPEHGGTHLDAPVHFARGARDVASLPVEDLVAAAVVIDVASAAAADADYRLSAGDVAAWEEKHGRIGAGTFVLLRTGWSSRWGDLDRYLGDDTPGDASDLHFPSYGEDAARLLVEERRVAALGVDTASIDHGPSRDFVVHRIAGAANVVGLENLANLERLPPTGAWIVALPMKIAGGSGAPLRAVALLPR